MKKVLFAVAISFLTCMSIGCSGDGHKKISMEDYLIPERNVSTGEYSLVLSDSVVCDVPEKEYNVYTQIQTVGSELYCFSALDPLRLSVYDIDSGVHTKSIVYDPNILRSREIIDYQVLSRDSILLVTAPGGAIVLSDGTGRICERWAPELLGAELTGGGGHSDYMGAGKICLVMCPGTRYSIERPESDGPRHWIYNLETRMWDGEVAALEGALRYSDGVYYFDMMIPYHLVKGKFLYVTYMADHSVYVYDLKSGEMVLEKDISPEDAEKMPAPAAQEVASYENLSALRRETAFYGPLCYHSKSRLFSRCYTYSLDKRKQTGYDKEVCIYDEDFNLVGSERFVNGEVRGIFPTHDGFVATRDVTSDADHVTFLKYRISE